MIVKLLNGTTIELPFGDVQKAKEWLIDNKIFEECKFPEHLYFAKVEDGDAFIVAYVPPKLCLKVSDTVDNFRQNWSLCTNICLLRFAIAHITKLKFASLCANPHPLVVDALFKQPFEFHSLRREWLNQNPNDRVVTYLLHEKPLLVDLEYMVENINQQAIRHCFNTFNTFKQFSVQRELFKHTTDVEIIDYIWKKNRRYPLPYNPHPHAVQLMIRDMGIQAVIETCTDPDLIQLGLTECELHFSRTGKVPTDYIRLGSNPSDLVVDYVLSKPFDVILQFRTFIYNSNPRACEFWMNNDTHIYREDQKWYRIYRYLAAHPYPDVVEFIIDKMKDDPFNSLKKMIDEPSELYGGGRVEPVMAIVVSKFSVPLVSWLFTNQQFLDSIPVQDVAFFHWKAMEALSKCEETVVDIV